MLSFSTVIKKHYFCFQINCKGYYKVEKCSEEYEEEESIIQPWYEDN